MSLTEPEIVQTLMKWRTRLSAAAWMVVRDTHAAEDIFQNVAVKSMTREVHFESEAALLSWAFITARREGIDRLRKVQREAYCLDLDVLTLLERDWQSTSCDTLSAKLNALQECLESIPETSRQLLRLRYFEGFSGDEIARRLGVRLDAFYKRISRLHAALRNCVEVKLNNLGTAGESNQ